jgi:uncharacterized protein (UPF0332 family)
MDNEEKWKRTRRSAKHLLAAIVFNESSIITLQKTQSLLLACIGYYYVGFHCAVTMLWLCPTVAMESLNRVRHSQIKKLIEQNLIQRKKLDRSFLYEYEQLQDFREYANYNFGSKIPKYEYSQITPIINVITDSILIKTREVLFNELEDIDMVLGFQTTIGDDIGSDLIKLHTGTEISNNVWDYLVKYKLTT